MEIIGKDILLRKRISSLYKIIIEEDNELYTLDDSIVIANTEIKYQIQVTQSKINILELTNNEDVLIDGEYDIDNITLERYREKYTEYIHSICFVWDEQRKYVLGLSFHNTNNEFILGLMIFADEIHYINNIKDFTAKINIVSNPYFEKISD